MGIGTFHLSKSKWRTAIGLFAIMIGYSMALLDTTIVNITLPKMSEFYGTDMKTISWVLNGYNLAFAVLLVTASRLADQFGRKRVFLIGVGLFTLSSYLCGVSSSADLLIAFRVMQGIAGAMLVPVTLPMSMLLVPKNRQGLLMGVWGALGGLMSAGGPVLGGLLAEHADWQWIFFINIPTGIITFLLCLVLIPESIDTTASKRIDWVGALLLTVSMFSLTLALVQVSDKGWTSISIELLLAIGIGALVLFFLAEARVTEPMLPLWLLKVRPFSAGMGGMFTLSVGMTGIAFLVTFYLTMSLGMSQQAAGDTIAVMPLVSIVFAGAAGPLSQKFGSRWLSIAGLLIFGAAIYLFGWLTPDSTRADVIWRMAVAGMGLGIAMTPMTMASMQAVPADKYGISSGVNNMTRTLGQVIGIAVLVTLFNANVNSEMSGAKAQAVALIQSDAGLNAQAKSSLLAHLEQMQGAQGNSVPTGDQEMRGISEQIAKLYRTGFSRAFDDTFKSISWFMVLGAASCFFLEPVRRRSEKRGSLR
ncbi:MFS transporter [Gorillibacterium massiliense]|uniref:MFS transporter n=1 Tax=Gorillibacterium massiliense TaxID=1280390 RepID=UPI0004BC0448|nr:MFS transporter [Gorillibacterium massiliense]